MSCRTKIGLSYFVQSLLPLLGLRCYYTYIEVKEKLSSNVTMLYVGSKSIFEVLRRRVYSLVIYHTWSFIRLCTTCYITTLIHR